MSLSWTAAGQRGGAATVAGCPTRTSRRFHMLHSHCLVLKHELEKLLPPIAAGWGNGAAPVAAVGGAVLCAPRAARERVLPRGAAGVAARSAASDAAAARRLSGLYS